MSIQTNLRSTSDWDSFMADTAKHFNVPLDTLYQIALFFLAQEYYNQPSTQQEGKKSSGRTTLRSLREQVRQTSH